MLPICEGTSWIADSASQMIMSAPRDISYSAVILLNSASLDSASLYKITSSFAGRSAHFLPESAEIDVKALFAVTASAVTYKTLPSAIHAVRYLCASETPKTAVGVPRRMSFLRAV